MRLVDWYNKRSEEGRNIFLLVLIAIAGFAATFIFFFLNNPGVPLGFLFGSLIEIIAYITIVKSAKFMLDPNGLSRKKALLAPLFMVMRFLLYAGGLVLGAFATYRWGSMSCSYLNFWAVFAGYMPMVVILLFTTLYRLKRAPSNPAPKQDESNGEESHD